MVSNREMERDRERPLYLERKIFHISLESLGNQKIQKVIKLEEYKRGGFSSWLHFSVEVTCWLCDVIKEAIGMHRAKRWPKRDGEYSYLYEDIYNDDGTYLRISKVRRGDGDKSYAICIPCGDNGYYWGVLMKELKKVMPKTG